MARSGVSGAVCCTDYITFKDSIAQMPAVLPVLETGKWENILDKTMDSMKYTAWRRVVEVRFLRYPGIGKSAVANLVQASI